MTPQIVFTLRPRHAGEVLQVWHIAPAAAGAATVLVEREDPSRNGRCTIAWPFEANLNRLVQLVEQEHDRVLPAARETARRLRELAHLVTL